MTYDDYTPRSSSPFGTQTLVDAPTEELHYGPPPPPPPLHRDDALVRPEPVRRRRGTAFGAAAVLLAVSLGSGYAGAELATRNDAAQPAAAVAPAQLPVPAATKDATTNPSGTQPRELLAQVAAAVRPSVVSIAVRGAGGGGEGSGVILTADGTIMTNNHVVEGAADGGTVTVRFSDGKSADATIVGRDEATDLAVLKAQNVSGLTPAKLGDDEQLHVGDTVLAIGSPLGLEGSVSAGIVSALHVALSGAATTGSLGDAIQTDAPINPGNSGGALVNMAGEVIGINTAIATVSAGGGQSGNIGLGFAIPITHAKAIADQLLRGETPGRSILGVQVGDASAGGAQIESVTPGGAAEKSGLRAGDVITAVGDTRVRDAASLTSAIRARQPGETVNLTYTRGGTSATTTATLGTATS